jgi:hypothetical protein
MKPFYSLGLLTSKAQQSPFFYEDLAEDLWPEIVSIFPNTLLDDISEEGFDGLIFSLNKHLVSNDQMLFGDYKFKPKRKITVDIEFKQPDLCFIDNKMVGKLETTTDFFTGQIIEVAFINPSTFKLIKLRQDKLNSNSMSVFKSNLSLWKQDFKFSDLFKISRKRKGAYWQPNSKQPDTVLQQIRHFHNRVVKHDLFKKQSPSRKGWHLEVGAGQGGDLSRIMKLTKAENYVGVVFVDKDPSSLQELQRRLKAFETNHLEFIFMVLDLTVQISELIRLKRTFQTISAQFCLHYFADGLPHLLKLLEPKGSLFGSMFDIQRVKQMFQKTNKKTIDFGFARIEDLGQNRIDVWIESINQSHKETLVDLHQLVPSTFTLRTRSFETYATQGQYIHPFSSLYQTFDITPK